MKYQFQFAGIDFNRPSAPQRKRMRNSLLAVAFVLAGLGYWQYLHFLAHGRAPVLAHAAAAMPVVTSAKPMVPEAATQLPPALKQAADAGVTALFTRLIGSVKIPTAVSAPPPVSANPAPAQTEVERVPLAAEPVAYVAPKPRLHRPPVANTPEQRLQRAAQIALGNMLDLANKYPDAYGFGPGDIFEETKLGGAIPVYTIAEADRANYKSGQPVKPLLKPANQWVFPVLVGNRTCCMLQVQYTGHDYVPGTGSKSLAMAWAKITDKWRAEDGFHPQLVVNPGVPGYYFTIPELPAPNMTDTVQMFYYHPDLSPANVILASWR
jgi:hypothetical protein